MSHNKNGSFSHSNYTPRSHTSAGTDSQLKKSRKYSKINIWVFQNGFKEQSRAALHDVMCNYLLSSIKRAGDLQRFASVFIHSNHLISVFIMTLNRDNRNPLQFTHLYHNNTYVVIQQILITFTIQFLILRMNYMFA